MGHHADPYAAAVSRKSKAKDAFDAAETAYIAAKGTPDHEALTHAARELANSYIAVAKERRYKRTQSAAAAVEPVTPELNEHAPSPAPAPAGVF